jgi:hypothetical protein
MRSMVLSQDFVKLQKARLCFANVSAMQFLIELTSVAPAFVLAN